MGGCYLLCIFNNIIVSGGLRGILEINAIELASVLSDHNLFWGFGTDNFVERYSGTWDDPPGLLDEYGQVYGFYERDRIATAKETLGLK